MISHQLKEQIKYFLNKEEYEIDWLISCIAQFKCSDRHLVQLLINYADVFKIQNSALYKQMTAKHLDLCNSYPHHVKAITLASLLHNQIQMHHPDLVISLLDTNRHITLTVLMETLYNPQHESNLAD